jgi:hypothetical protein
MMREVGNHLMCVEYGRPGQLFCAQNIKCGSVLDALGIKLAQS